MLHLPLVHTCAHSLQPRLRCGTLGMSVKPWPIWRLSLATTTVLLRCMRAHAPSCESPTALSTRYTHIPAAPHHVTPRRASPRLATPRHATTRTHFCAPVHTHTQYTSNCVSRYSAHLDSMGRHTEATRVQTAAMLSKIADASGRSTYSYGDMHVDKMRKMAAQFASSKYAFPTA